MPLAHAKLCQEKLYAKETIQNKACFIQKATKGRNAKSDTQDNARNAVQNQTSNVLLIHMLSWRQKKKLTHMKTSRAHSYVPKKCGYTTHIYTGTTSCTKPSLHSFKTENFTTKIRAEKNRNDQKKENH